jgi:hypothetical protein
VITKDSAGVSPPQTGSNATVLTMGKYLKTLASCKLDNPATLKLCGTTRTHEIVKGSDWLSHFSRRESLEIGLPVGVSRSWAGK